MFGLFNKKELDELQIPGATLIFYQSRNENLGNELMYVDFNASQHRKYSGVAINELSRRIFEEFHKVLSEDSHNKPNGGFYDSGQIHLIIKDIGNFEVHNIHLVEAFGRVKHTLEKSGVTFDTNEEKSDEDA